MHGGLRVDYGAQLPGLRAVAVRRAVRNLRGRPLPPHASALLADRRKVQGALSQHLSITAHLLKQPEHSVMSMGLRQPVHELWL